MVADKPKALVVDDEPANLTMLELLCREWYTVDGVRSLAQAEAKLQENTYALTIIDHRLTDAETGLALFEATAGNKVLLSSDAMAAWTAARGGQWLRKPIDFLAAKKLLRALSRGPV